MKRKIRGEWLEAVDRAFQRGLRFQIGEHYRYFDAWLRENLPDHPYEEDYIFGPICVTVEWDEPD